MQITLTALLILRVDLVPTRASVWSRWVVSPWSLCLCCFPSFIHHHFLWHPGHQGRLQPSEESLASPPLEVRASDWQNLCVSKHKACFIFFTGPGDWSSYSPPLECNMSTWTTPVHILRRHTEDVSCVAPIEASFNLLLLFFNPFS